MGLRYIIYNFSHFFFCVVERELEPRSRNLDLRLRLLSFYHRLEEILQEKNMVAEEVFCKLLQF
jgi:hypothetical protein